MSKKIDLYSEDKKHRCAVELADSCDRFNCPDHSMLVLFEERENGTYVIAQAQDHLLETEKDQQIAELKQQLAEKDEEIEILKKALELACKDKLPPDEDVTIKFCDTGFQTSSYEELIEYYKQQAEKEKK